MQSWYGLRPLVQIYVKAISYTLIKDASPNATGLYILGSWYEVCQKLDHVVQYLQSYDPWLKKFLFVSV